MRVSINNKTGLMIESQSRAAEGTLTENAEAAGFDDVTEKDVTDAEYRALLEAKGVPVSELL